ncbi:MAG TPA: sugar transferase [Candidatus Binatia bacterium]|jgi:exopolysaccharide biosynthesis polyprenyl glycosylphosphotransferase
MSATLLFIEGSSIFGAVYMVLAGWMHLLFRDWSLMHVASQQAFGFSICCSFAFYYNGLYNLGNVRNWAETSPRLIRSIPLALLLLALLYTVFPGSKITPGLLILSACVVAGVLLASRALFYEMLRRRPFSYRVLILGTGPLAQKLIRQMELQPACRYSIAGIVDDSATSTLFEDESLRHVLERVGYPYMGPLRHLRKIIDISRPDRIIVAQPEGLERCPVRHILLEYRPRGIVIEDAVEVYERMTGKVAIEWLKPETLLFSKDFRRSRFDEGLARVTSFIAAVLGMIVLAPFFLLVALVIKLDSRGPILFIQERIGRNGKPFNLLKFRTMHPAEETTSEWVSDNVDRITRAGKWLRKFRLDELPQLWNVVNGEMNLVGPRPHPASNFALFVLVSRNAPECGQPIPYYALRSMVRPGITGWAQIRYRYANGLDEEIEKMRYDLYYIKHMSFYFDVRILFQTIKVVLFGQESRDAAAAELTAESGERLGSAA